MPDYIVAYRGGKRPDTAEQRASHMQDWQAWVGGLGDLMVNPGTPLGKSKIVSRDGVSDDAGPNALTGYSIVKAGSMEAALEIARECPVLDLDGTLEVAQIKEM